MKEEDDNVHESRASRKIAYSEHRPKDIDDHNW
jgi:hypothetical protein